MYNDYVVSYSILVSIIISGGNIMSQILDLLAKNARLSNAELAVMLGMTESEVAAQIEALEKSGVIKGYTTLIDQAAENPNMVTAYIELKVNPMAESGFDDIARFIAQYDAVKTVTLMSGAYDLGITIIGENLRVISEFVARQLATIDGIVSTATHFELKSYKENGILMCEEENDERGFVSP